VRLWQAQIAAARQAWNQLSDAIARPTETEAFTPLPRPDSKLELERLCVTIPGQSEPLIRPFGFQASGGHMIAVLGGNGEGKTTLLQTLAGAYVPRSGAVKLGGRNLHKWAVEDRGQYIGYVPQSIELLPGTVGENIARMTDAAPADIIEAAKKSGAHDMILGLPKGYETQVGTPGIGGLSAGQRQLVGLARAVFGNPVLIILDEPTANLDPAAVFRTVSHLNSLAKSGTIVIAATHDLKLIQATSNVLVVKAGGIMSADTRRYLEVANPQKKSPKAANKRGPLHAVGDSHE